LTVNPVSRYKAALAALFLVAPGPAPAAEVGGATLPDEARALEPYRYRVDRSYEDTLKFFRAIYPPARYPRTQIANQPGLKAVHIENPEARPGGWDGLNVYDLKGETRVFVLTTPGKREAPRGR
jgi:hypothetical protein